MKLTRHRLLLLFALIVSLRCFGQDKKTPTATWLLPGVSYQASPSLRLLDQFGVDPSQHAFFNYLQGFVDLNKHFTINAGYFYFHEQSGNAKSYLENDGYLGASYITSIGRFVVDDRNMLNSVFPETGQQKNFYRNRIRMTFPFLIQANVAKIYVFDEGYYLFNREQWTRNRIAAGISYNPVKAITLDLSYWRQSDYFSGNINLFFVQVTLNLPSKKAAR